MLRIYRTEETGKLANRVVIFLKVRGTRRGYAENI